MISDLARTQMSNLASVTKSSEEKKKIQQPGTLIFTLRIVVITIYRVRTVLTYIIACKILVVIITSYSSVWNSPSPVLNILSALFNW